MQMLRSALVFVVRAQVLQKWEPVGQSTLLPAKVHATTTVRPTSLCGCGFLVNPPQPPLLLLVHGSWQWRLAARLTSWVSPALCGPTRTCSTRLLPCRKRLMQSMPNTSAFPSRKFECAWEVQHQTVWLISSRKPTTMPRRFSVQATFVIPPSREMKFSKHLVQHRAVTRSAQCKGASLSFSGL